MTVIRVGKIEISVGNRKRGDQGTYIGRPTVLGNPFTVIQNGRADAIKRYRDWLREKIVSHDAAVCGALDRMRKHALEDGKLVLVCWCAPMPCHGNVIADELARALAEGRSFLEAKT